MLQGVEGNAAVLADRDDFAVDQRVCRQLRAGPDADRHKQNLYRLFKLFIGQNCTQRSILIVTTIDRSFWCLEMNLKNASAGLFRFFR